MKKKRAAACVAVFLLAAAVSGGALSPDLSRRASSWFEVGFGVAWSPSRGVSMLGWRFTFLVSGPIAFATSVLLSDAGGYATIEGKYFYDPGTAAGDVALPIAVGLGLARRNREVSAALSIAGGASWYPLTISGSPPQGWIVGFGAELGAGVYLLSWGVEPVFTAHLLVPANLSAADAHL